LKASRARQRLTSFYLSANGTTASSLYASLSDRLSLLQINPFDVFNKKWIFGRPNAQLKVNALETKPVIRSPTYAAASLGLPEVLCQ
jgi:hypothetical protein